MALPLTAGEATRTLVRRRIDWILWIALVIGTAGPFIWLQSLIRSARQYADTFWSPPTLEKLTTFYRELAEPFALVLAVALGCIVLAKAVWPDVGHSGEAERTHRSVLGIDEIVVTLALAALPFAGYALAMLTGAFHGRYVLQAVLGLGILVGWGAATLIANRITAAILVTVLFAVSGARLAAGAAGLLRGPADGMADHELLLSIPADGLPVAVSRALDYLPISHYCRADVATRLVFLTKPARTPLDMRTADRALQRLAQYAPLQIQEFDRFLTAHDRFYLYGRSSWMVQGLLERNVVMRFLGEREGGTLYLVEVRP
jgi:hypothetical protein